MTTMLRFAGSRLLVIGAGAGIMALVAALAIAISRDVGQDPLGEVDPGLDRVGAFTLPSLDGGSVAIADYARGPVFLYFWASWCAPCEREAPLIEQLWAEYGLQGYTFVGINILDSERAARGFVERHALTFPMLLDGEGDVYFEFGVNGVPEAYFLAAGLEVERKYIGELLEPEFRAMLEGIRGDLVRSGS
ncbi:MAG: TlpA disulfide reductase family protein [Chloroflexi bacterium]|nr:TlpA disulfide reductase family protein [Chloroflexota bacterium]MQC28200.1 TlpA family protein disulfide reductase [Chloroflexota bacterium]